MTVDITVPSLELARRIAFYESCSVGDLRSAITVLNATPSGRDDAAYSRLAVVKVALIAAEEALSEAQENVGDDPDSLFAEPLRLVREALS
jgi:hypothetical protein